MREGGVVGSQGPHCLRSQPPQEPGDENVGSRLEGRPRRKHRASPVGPEQRHAALGSPMLPAHTLLQENRRFIAPAAKRCGQRAWAARPLGDGRGWEMRAVTAGLSLCRSAASPRPPLHPGEASPGRLIEEAGWPRENRQDGVLELVSCHLADTEHTVTGGRWHTHCPCTGWQCCC